jgi:hypothetical protein
MKLKKKRGLSPFPNSENALSCEDINRIVRSDTNRLASHPDVGKGPRARIAALKEATKETRDAGEKRKEN